MFLKTCDKPFFRIILALFLPQIADFSTPICRSMDKTRIYRVLPSRLFLYADCSALKIASTINCATSFTKRSFCELRE